RKYKCKICEKSFTTSGHLARHSRIHTGERKHVCPYPGCDSRFARQDNCMQHYRTHLNPKNKSRKKKTLK
ncbi:C2H2-type zinc finger protein ASCRUDRAFT_19013, partial [Ascoidea rubescens DSM 1968]